MKKKNTNRKPPFILRMVKGIVKLIAVILAVCIGGAALCGCIVGSVSVANMIHDRGGSYYETAEEIFVSLVKKALGKDVEKKDTAPTQDGLIAQVQAIAAAQEETDALLLAELASGAYSAEAPFVLVNPYGISPLTALALFNTEEPAQVSIRIAGDTKLADVAYSFEGYNTDHMIPIYGLYASRENDVELSLSYKNGKKENISLTVETDALPDALSHEMVRAYLMDEKAYQPGLNFTYMGNNGVPRKSAIDVNGDYRWFLDNSDSASLLYSMGYCGNYNGGNSVFLSCGSIDYGAVTILEMNYMGKLLNAWFAPYGAHHDIELTEDTLLITGSTSLKVKEDMVYEIDRETGEILTVLNYDEVLQVYRDQTQDYPEITNFYKLGDWLHINSIATHEDQLIISGRHQSSVVSTDREGNINWILSNPTDYYEYFQQYLLKPVGDNFSYPLIQHAAEVLPDQDGNPDTLDILLFDNGEFRGDASTFASRMAQYRIHEREMTVEQVWEYGGDRTELYSYRHGDADLLANGNYLGSFEPYDNKFKTWCAYGIEVKPDGSPVWECWRLSRDSENLYCEYRLERMNIYAEAANDLQLGKAANIHLPG